MCRPIGPSLIKIKCPVKKINITLSEVWRYINFPIEIELNECANLPAHPTSAPEGGTNGGCPCLGTSDRQFASG